MAQKKIPVVIDTDIGADIDDAFALALAIASPELEIRGITTVGRGGSPDPFVQHISKGRDEDRAWLVCRLLTQVGLKNIPVAAGADPQPKSSIDWQIQYRRHPAAIYNRTLKPVKESAVELMARLAKEADGELTLIAIGPLTNVARFIKEQPAAAKRLKRIVLMGGSIGVGYKGEKRPEPEWNIESDIPAAQAVFKSGLPLTVIPLDVTATLKLEKKPREAIFAAHTPLTWQVQNLYDLWDRPTPILFDPVAVMAAINEGMIAFKEMHLEVSDKGMTLAKEGKANARVATDLKAAAFVETFVDRLRSYGKASLPQPPKNASKLVEPGLFPTRVHAFEDYDTSIERRWWMCGKLERSDLPRSVGRAMRAVLTQDFDDKQGDASAMYRAVIFNPVPGPPMGPNARLRFRCKLTGTDTIRVQLYSLSNGYHRYLSVPKLEQGKWLEGCVDLTQMRRPDGSGGALGAGERIDDIQFYVDPRAELLIDDVVLFDAAAASEKRAFPKRILYTGLFDTGKQGREWPGDFDIVNHEKPRTGKAARSVERKIVGDPWIRLDLRGERLLDRRTELNFKFKLDKPADVRVELYSRVAKKAESKQTIELPGGAWGEQTLRFTALPDTPIDEIRFLLPSGELLVDDVLLYTPGG
ncbi:MAG TPA: nucleoside hydrolase [Urbifossiella sp.]|nr:nucleoside hydrolase [Urbifossiella sp.]